MNELRPDDIMVIAKALGAFWTYDYRAATKGKVGMHAELKSGLHSDGFFVSRILLARENIKSVICTELALKIREQLRDAGLPDYVIGVPDSATILGEGVGEILGVKVARMIKNDGKMFLMTDIKPEEVVLLIEDVCTRGTGFTEAVGIIRHAQPSARIFPFDPVIINRGGLEKIMVEGVGDFDVLPLANVRLQDWESAQCPLCLLGSKPIKPKATDENWEAITHSQL